MANKYSSVEKLITKVREETKNSNVALVNAGASLTDSLFVERLNDAQELCVELMSNNFSTYFFRTKEYTIDTSQSSYEELTLPDDALYSERIVSVEYSRTGQARYYYPLEPYVIRDRYTGDTPSNYQCGYIVSGNKIILAEKPVNGSKVRLVYESQPPRLDVYKAKVTSGSLSGTTYTGVYDTSSAHADITNEWDVNDSINVTDRSNGSRVIKEGLLTSINKSTGDFTIDVSNAEYTASALVSGNATNLRLIDGWRTNYPELPLYTEKFLIAHAATQIFGNDGSILARNARARFEEIKESMIRTYLLNNKDIANFTEFSYGKY